MVVLILIGAWLAAMVLLMSLAAAAARGDRQAVLQRAAMGPRWLPPLAPSQPASTGSKAWSLTSVSASSAAGSESRTTPTPA
jgi:hypothetical protein